MGINSYSKYGINVNNESMFFRKFGNNKLNSKMMAISAFTSSDYSLQLSYELKKFKIHRLDDKKFVMDYNGDHIEFTRISDHLESEEDEKKLLLNYELRKRMCHLKSMQFIYIAKHIVTGYVDNSDGFRIIHSWLENDDKVIDYTYNLIIDKEIYYSLMNVEVLSSICKENVLNDIQSKFLSSFLGIKFYLLFRDELERDGIIQFGEDDSYKKAKSLL